MKPTRIHLVRTTLAVGAMSAVGTALLSPGVANAADPAAGPLLDSTCTFAQVDAATHAEAPALAKQLDAHPQRKAMLQRAFDKPPAERRAMFEQLIRNHPQQAQRVQTDPRYQQAAQKIRQIADTCHNY